MKIKPVKKGQPGVAGGGVKKFYASPVMDGELTLAGLTKAIEKICTVSGADVRAVLYALVDVATDSLADGTIVRLGDLGSLRMSISAEGVESAEDVLPSTVKGASIIFTPGTRLKEVLETMKYQRV
jgi:predicted histone-like DNA-binding protein